ncbi:hypothetical protein ACFWDI_40680 [Streptomyces sp. NPDC060064]|uniref:hypothetical protein n=1 Tax=Streptomyces sp. NPDC060064 TaxID=3347049 RepID=UPI00368E2082
MAVARARRTDDIFADYDRTTGTFALDNGTLLATAKCMWTKAMENGVEHWRITTTVAKGTYFPVDMMSVEWAEVKVGPPIGAERITLDTAVIAIVDEGLAWPVITIKWQANDRHELWSWVITRPARSR